MADTPLSDNPVNVNFKITSDGNPIADSIQVVSVKIKSEINKIPNAFISIYDWDQISLGFTVSDSDTFKPGAKIAISVGYDSSMTQIFSGVVIRNKINATSDGQPTLEVECRDTLLKMTIGRKNEYYIKQKDSDIISTLVSNAGGSATVDATTVQHEELLQYYCSDWDFMITRAEANGYVVVVENGTVTAGKPKVSADPVLTCTFGSDLTSFDAELDAEKQFSEVKATAWDPASQSMIQVTSSNPSVNSQGNLDSSTLSQVLGVSYIDLQTSGNMTQEDLTAWADALMVKSWLSRIKGSATFKGSSKVKPGSIVEFKKRGEATFRISIHFELWITV